MPTREGVGPEPSLEFEDWTVGDRPGVKLTAGGEYAIGQVLSNGYTINWTTEESAADAVVRWGVLDRTATTATVCYDHEDRVLLDGPQIVSFLREHDSWWVKVRHPEADDYVLFVKGSAGAPDELAVVGAPLEILDDQTEARVQDIRALMQETTTPTLRANLDQVFERLIKTVRREIPPAVIKRLLKSDDLMAALRESIDDDTEIPRDPESSPESSSRTALRTRDELVEQYGVEAVEQAERDAAQVDRTETPQEGDDLTPDEIREYVRSRMRSPEDPES